MSDYPDDVPNCPTCKIPLRLKHLGDGRGWAVWCVKGTTLCEFRASRIFRPTKLEAIAAWLSPAVKAGWQKGVAHQKKPRPSPRKGQGKYAHVGSVDTFPRCHCGSRILDGGTDCGGVHPTIHDYIRSGQPAGGANGIR